MHGENPGGQTGPYRRLELEAKGKCGDGAKTSRIVIPILRLYTHQLMSSSQELCEEVPITSPFYGKKLSLQVSLSKSISADIGTFFFF